jgi:predicted metal-dependent hydrolase
MPKLPIADGELEYTVRRGSGSRYVYLRFDRDNRLQIVLPRRSRQDPGKIIEEKRRWIERKYRELSGRTPVFDGGRVLFRGRYRRLDVNVSEGDTVEIVDDRIVVSVSPGGDPDAVLKAWLIREAEDYLVAVAPGYAERLGVRLKEIRVRNIGLWGYCTRRGVLAFSWQIITLPEDLADYLVAHEVAHLAEFNHSRRFRRALSSLCPGFREREVLLKTFVPPAGSRPRAAIGSSLG